MTMAKKQANIENKENIEHLIEHRCNFKAVDKTTLCGSYSRLIPFSAILRCGVGSGAAAWLQKTAPQPDI